MKHPEMVECHPDSIPDVGYPEKMECRKGDRPCVHGVGIHPEQLHPDSPRGYAALTNITYPDDSISYPDMLSGSLSQTPCILDLLMAKDFKASVLHFSELSIALPWIPKNSPQSRIALVIKKLSKHQNLTQFD